MKKLVSICFLSILFSVFSVQAQRDCCFQLFNPSADTLHGIANLPNGDLPLNHTMNKLVYQGTDVYDLMFSNENCLGIDYETGKVSIETELWLDGVNILDGQHDLSSYCDISLQTYYNELHWLGKPIFSNDYPGANQWTMGTYPISNIAFDYFYFKFLVNTKSRIVITWNQYFQDAVLIVNIRERFNGTNNELYWDEGQRQNLGGHQSQPGRILASDTLTNRDLIIDTTVIKDCDPFPVGNPEYTMDTTGIYNIAYVDTSCGYRIDSVIIYDYTHYVHPTTPTLSDSTFNYCQKVPAEPIVLPVEPNPALADHADQIVAYWSVYGNDFVYMPSFTPITDTTAGTYEFYVKRHDNLWGCESEIDTFHVTINQIPEGPVVPSADRVQEYCVGDAATQLAYNGPLPAGMQVIWGTDPDAVASTVAPTPTTTAAGTQVYYLRIQDMNSVNQCVSADYDSIIVNVYANPVVTISAEKDTVCYGESTKLLANPTNLSSYQWKLEGVDITGATDTTYTYTNEVMDTTAQHFTLFVTEDHDEVICVATSDEYVILAYPEIGTPTFVSGDTVVCGPQEITLKVANGAHASTSTWYAADKSTVLATGTEYTATYTGNTTLYVSSSNDFGCETDKDNWLRINVTVNDIPQITLIADNNGEVCAESELTIKARIVDTTSSVFAFQWTSVPATGVTFTPDNDSITAFKAMNAGIYDVKVLVTDHNGCENVDSIKITVDTLPIIVAEVNYNVYDNDYCVGNNGKIIFTTPDYVKYSIDSANTWQTGKSFENLPADNYYLVVENANGCRNHANLETIVDAPAIRTLTVTDTANTHCEAPYNGVIVAHITAVKQGRTPATPATYEYTLTSKSRTWAPTTDSVFTNLKQGEYKLYVENTTTGCVDSITTVLDSNYADIKLFLSDSANTHCAEPYGGFIYVDSVTPLATYQYKLDQIYTTYQLSNTFAQLPNGHYTVFAQDTVTRCVASDTVNVRFIGILPTGTISTLPFICFGDTAKVSFVPDGAAKFQNWTYTGPATDELINPIKNLQSFTLKNFPAGKHTFTAHFIDTVTKCINEVTETIRVIGVNINLHQITAGPNICENDTVIVYCEYFPDDATADHITDYHWYHPNHFVVSADTIKVLPNNTESGKRVSVVATDNHNCQSTKYIDLKVYGLPNIKLEGEVEYCQNTVTNIVASTDSLAPKTYKWTLDGVVASTNDTLSVLLTRDTVAVVTVTDGHGCKNDSTIVINMVEVPGAPVFTPETQYFCVADDINVTPTQNAPQIGTLVWNGNNNPNVVKVAGTYSARYDTVHSASLTCHSDTTTVTVVVPGAPSATITIKYNDETSASDSTARCYVETPTDTLHVNVAPIAYATATDTLAYTYTLNGHTATANMVLSHVAPGTYTDTIGISARRVYPDMSACTWDTTIYYHFTVNPLPQKPSNFPIAHNGVGNPTIFYCEGNSPVSYSFSIPSGVTAKYTYGTSVNVPTQPDSAYNDIKLILTTVYGCVDTFKYDIVEIATPTITVTRQSDDSYCQYDVFQDTITAQINSFAPADSSIFDWNLLTRTLNRHKTTDIDTVHHTFTQMDTMAIVNAAVIYANGEYSATCYIANPDTIDIEFISAPTKPELLATTAGYYTIDTATYCAGSPVAITKTNFTSSSDSIIIYSAGVAIPTITTKGNYEVVAYSKLAPYCPSDTLDFVLIENRQPEVPVNLFPASMYNDTVYYCANSTASYNFIKANPNDSFTYAVAGSTTFSTTQPTTEGTYTIRITDVAAIANACYKDTTFKIKKMNMPNYIFTKPVVFKSTNIAWADTNICFTDNHYNVEFEQNVTKHYTRLPEATPVVYRIWNGDTIPGSAGKKHLYDFDVTKDTVLSFVYSEYDTVGSTGYGVACPYWNSDTIAITYFGPLAAPVYTADTAFCNGSSLDVTVAGFATTYVGDTMLYTNPTLPQTYTTAGGTVKAVAYYNNFTTCHSDTTTITIVKNDLPTVAITVVPISKTICKGDTATLTAIGAASYVWSTAETTDVIKVTDSIKYVVTGTDLKGCSNTDTVKIDFYPGFEVQMMNDTVVCEGQSVVLSASVIPTSGTYTYEWYENDATSPIGTTNPYGPVTPATSVIVEGTPIPTLYKLKVTDEYNCVSVKDSNVVEVVSTDRPQFEFREIGGAESIRSLEAHVGDNTSFELYVHQNCWNPDVRVFVDFQIYKNGVPMTDEELATTLDHTIGIANTSYSFDLTHNAPAISTLRMSSSNFNTASNFFPQSEMLDGASYSFDWFYLHFLSDRKVTVDLGSWKPASAGEYTITYAVIVASEYSALNGLLYNTTKKVGGHSSHIGLSAKDTIAFDYFTIYVDDPSASGEGNDDITSITTLNSAASVDMKVYPNPANVSVNVAVAGVQGKTNVQVFDMSGKAVISTQVNVDYDGQIITLPVDNFAQGMYFIKVVNGDAMMTKKLVIKR